MFKNVTCNRDWLTILMAALFFFLFLSIGQALAYMPPIGIPDPGFGIDDIRPNRPNDWSSEVAGYYYINQEKGTNTGRAYGSPTAPRASIPSVLPAGSYVEVHGTYTSGSSIVVTGKGTNGNWVANMSGPVWIVGENEPNRPNFTQRIVANGSYLYFDTVSFSGSGSFQVGSATTGYRADHIVLRNSEAVGTPSVVRNNVSIVGQELTPVSNVVIYNNILRNAGDINANYDQDAHATSVGVHSSSVWFLENTIHTSSGSGAQVGGASSGYETCHHVYYGKNHVYNTRAAGLAVKYASDVVFSQNTLHDMIDTRGLYTISTSPSKGVGYQYAPNRLWILYNHIYNASYGIYGGSTNSGTDWYIYAIGNVIHDITRPAVSTYSSENAWSEAGIMMAGGKGKYIINNTIYKVVGGIHCPAVSIYQMKNNIISNVTDVNGYHILMDSGDGAKLSILENSIVHQGDRTEKIRWSSSYVGSLSYVKNATGQLANSSSADPKFIDVANNNFKLQVGSFAVDNGVVHDVYEQFQSLYGIDIRRDISGNLRSIGYGFDIGAYEFSNQSPSPSPTIKNISPK